MATKIDLLNRELRNRIKAGRPNIWSHGNNLCFSLAKNGRASWVYRYTINGKRRVMTVQAFDDAISEKELKSLEVLAIEYGEQLKSGVDPLNIRGHSKAVAKTGDTFQEVAEAYIRTQRSGWKNAKHAEQWTSTLEDFVYPLIGSMLPHEIGIADVLRVLQQSHKRRNNGKAGQLWEVVPETASRVRMRIEKIISAAKSMGVGNANREIRARWANHTNPARWDDALEHWLTSQSRSSSHFAALPYQDVGPFVQELLAKRDFSSRALAFTILTGVRTSEALNAEWSEIDLASATWEIPAERMKANKIHRVPLSRAALDLLRKQPRYPGNPFVFPGAKKNRPLSNLAMLEVLRGMKGYGWTVHGFRSSLRDWITDTTIHPSEIAESVLAHTIGNKTEAAYRRGEAFQRRSVLMQQWCDYLTTNRKQYEGKWQNYLAITLKMLETGDIM
ncbi:site-specific integrase [Rhizobium sp. Root1220]|uniref:tyrosine-type recombinase/integrase n=1 Tax=Rhizobium sp. Root1220 TaxID=1736432 RepID=UPI000B13AB74|nr:site-specific integrase [Rhizobium sp. Root1220]